MKTLWMVTILLCGAAFVFAGPKHKQTLTLRWQPISAEQQQDAYAVSEAELLTAHKKLKNSLSKVGLEVQLGYLGGGQSSNAGSDRVGRLWIGSQTLEQWLTSLDSEQLAGKEMSSDIIVKAGLSAASKLLSSDTGTSASKVD